MECEQIKKKRSGTEHRDFGTDRKPAWDFLEYN